MAWSRRADLGGEGTTRAMHRPHNMVALGPQDLWAAGEGPNWALRLPGQSTQDSNRQKAAIRKEGVGSTGKAAHHHRRRRRITIEEGGASGKNSKVYSKRGVMTTGGRRLSEYRSAVIGIKARKSRLGGAQQRQSQRQKQKQLASTVANRFGQEIRVSRTSASGQEIQSQSCQGQP